MLNKVKKSVSTSLRPLMDKTSIMQRRNKRLNNLDIYKLVCFLIMFGFDNFLN